MHVVYYVVTEDDGVALDVRLVDRLDDEQLTMALSSTSISSSSTSYSSHLYNASVGELVEYKALLRLTFRLAVARPDFTTVESLVRRFYETQTSYPGLCI